MSDTTSTRRSWLSAPPAAPRVSAEEQAKKYPSWRLRVFLGIFLGYAGFYLIRNNIPLVTKMLQEQLHYNKVDIGLIANAALIAYGLSKFFMATLSDRSNARYFLPLGLALSAVANLCIAFIPALSASLTVFAVVMFINGWFQGMGWPPSGRVLVHWFSTNERGWKTAIWNCAHNVGGMAVGIIAAWGLQISGNQWQAAFWLPAIFALVVAVIAFFLVRDTPESLGFAPIEEFRNDPAKVSSSDISAEKLGYWMTIVKHVLLRPTMIYLALANVFVYALRYGILSWTPTYLKEVHKVSVTKGIAGFSLFELAGIFGTLACGWISDKVFKGNRTLTGVTFLAGVALFTILYWLAPVGTPYALLMTYLFFIGAFIYGPVMLIGLQALDMSAKEVAGTAAGFTGLFGYVIGATMASTGVGYLVHHFGWHVAFGALAGCAVLAILLLALVGPEEKRLMTAHKAASTQE